MIISAGKIRAFLITSALACALAGAAPAQDTAPVVVNIGPKDTPRTTPPNPRAKLPKKELAPATKPERPVIMHFGGGTFEKSIAVDPHISVSLLSLIHISEPTRPY